NATQPLLLLAFLKGAPVDGSNQKNPDNRQKKQQIPREIPQHGGLEKMKQGFEADRCEANREANQYADQNNQRTGPDVCPNPLKRQQIVAIGFIHGAKKTFF